MGERFMTVVVLANGLGTRMGGTRPKALLQINGRTSILEVILEGVRRAATQCRVLLFMRARTADLNRVLDRAGMPVTVYIEEPNGYFRDLVRIKHQHGFDEFVVIDSDLVVPPGELAAFIDKAATSKAWLTIGVTTEPERASGRPAWVRLDREGRLLEMDRHREMPYRTVGAFRWSDEALRGVSEPAPSASVMAHIASGINAGVEVDSFTFTRALNVNTLNDIAAAREIVHCAEHGSES